MATDRGPAEPRFAREDPSPSGPPFNWKVLAGALAALLVLAVVIVVLVAARGDGSDDVADPVLDPGSGPAETTVVVTDDFDRGDDPATLGSAPTGQAWRTANGEFGTIAGTAYLSSASPDAPRNFALVDIATGDGSVRARADRMCPGWGLVFRYVGPYNWWSIQAQPDFATYNVVKYLDGAENLVARLSPATVVDGTEIEVQFDGPVLRFYADGEQIGSVQDSHAQGGTSVGLVGNKPCAETGRWAEFEAAAVER